MKLKDWRERVGRSVVDVADEIGRTRQAVRNYELGRLPDRDGLEAIGVMTAGEVTPNDWFDVDRWRAGAAALVGAPAAEAA